MQKGQSAVLKGMQRGFLSLSGTSATVALSSVDSSKAFLIFSTSMNNDIVQNLSVRGEMISGTELKFTRFGDSGAVEIQWQVFEFTSGVSVQRGSIGQNAATKKVVLGAAVDLQKSFPILSLSLGGSVFGSDDAVTADLIHSDTLALQAYNSGATAGTVAWQVVQYDGCEVEKKTATLGSGNADTMVAITLVNPAKTLILSSQRQSANMNADDMPRTELFGTDSIRFTRVGTSANLNFVAYAVEFTDGSAVLRDTAHFSSGETNRTVVLPSAVDTSKTGVIAPGHYTQQGSTDHASSDNMGHVWFTYNLTSSTNLEIERAAGSSNAVAPWQVVSFPVAAPTLSSHPVSDTVADGTSAGFSVTAIGSGALSYQWQKDSVNIAGATSASYNFTAALADSGKSFRCVVTNSLGADTSNIANLHVTHLAPAITTQPRDTTVSDGSPASFRITASGTGALGYQWHKGGTAISGANSASYGIAAASLADSGAVYTCVVTNPGNSVTSSPAILKVVRVAPTIQSHPVSDTVLQGENATFTVSALGSLPLQYQWQKDNVNISSSTTASYTVTGASMSDSGSQYRCIVYNSADSAFSNAAVLSVTPLPPVITTQPASKAVADGDSAVFIVTATGHGSLAYQWRKGSAAITGATSSTYALAAALGDSGASFTCAVTNAGGTTVTNAAILTVSGVKPSITIQPVDASVNEGYGGAFTVAATGSAPLQYQWRKNGISIPGAISPSYTTPAALAADSGSGYSCRVSNAYGDTLSATARLIVSKLPAITLQPSDTTVYLAGAPVFKVSATSPTALAYQWRKNGVNIPGAVSASYSAPAAEFSQSGSLYTCVLTNAAGSVTTRSALLTVYNCTNTFSASSSPTSEVNEGDSLQLTGSAGCALRVNWSVVSGPNVELTDPTSAVLRLLSPRVSSDTTVVFRFSALTGEAWRSVDVAVRILNSTPDPVFSLPDPPASQPAWNGVDSLVLAPLISNWAEMRASGDSVLAYAWSYAGVPVDTVSGPGKLVLKTPMGSGKITVTLCLSNGGESVCAAKEITVKRATVSIDSLFGGDHKGMVEWRGQELIWNADARLRIWSLEGRTLFDKRALKGTRVTLPPGLHGRLRRGDSFLILLK